MKSQITNRSGLRVVKSGIGICILASALIEGAAAQTNVKLGTGAGASISSGTNDTAIGAGALTTTTTGSFNTAVGSSALRKNTTGASNVGFGYQALYKNITGGTNVGLGNKALTNNISGSNNIGIGNNGGSAITGSNNIAIGHTGTAGTTGLINIGTTGVHAGAIIAGSVFGGSFNATNGSFNATNGSFNATNANGNLALHGGLSPFAGTTLQGVFTGNAAGPQLRFQNSGSTSFIDIGEDASNNFVVEASDVAALTVLQNGSVTMANGLGVTGNVAANGRVGAGVASPLTTLHAVGTNTGSASPTGHIALIKETNEGSTAGLAIQSGYTFTHDTNDNFITFFKADGTSIGSIEGNNAGSIQLGGAGSDYAEYLLKSDPAMNIDATEIVGIRDGKIVGHGQPADQFMIVTGQAIVAGNRPSEDAADLAKRSLVSFIGQVPVQVRGQVNSGDFILASEKGDGTGIALPASKIDTAAMPRVVGRAWAASKEEGVKTVNTAVGLDQTSLVVPALQRLENENKELRDRMERLEKLLLEKSAASGLVNSEQ